MKIYTVVGARPNFIKIDPELRQEIIHTGQHYDYQMSKVFFKKLNLPEPLYNLKCKSEETGKMIDKLMKIFKKDKPTLIVVFGDTNSSLAGALAGAYCNIPVAHIEAGLRSYRKDMPEEINRVVIDHISTIRLAPNQLAKLNLVKEGLANNTFIVGDPLFDALGRFLPIKRTKEYRKYILLTLHRNFNTNKDNLINILNAFDGLSEKIIFPVHPRTLKVIKENGIKIPENVKLIKPVDYPKMLSLISNAKKVVTDSGGIQREAYWMNIPVIILREETEWTEIINNRGGILVGSNKELIKDALLNFNGFINSPPDFGANRQIREIFYKFA